MSGFVVINSPDDFTIVEDQDDWVLYTHTETEFHLSFTAVGINDAAIAVAAAAAAATSAAEAQAAADSIGDVAADAAAAVAAAAAAAASAVAADASADAAATDAVATAADRVQTGLDRIATAADRVQTGLDRVATGADVVSTDADRIAAEAAAALATSVIPTGGGTGQALVKASAADYDYAWASVSGTGDMVASIYDPTAVGADAFDRANHHGTQLASTISDFNTAADARVSAAIGATVQAYSANLATWSGLVPSADAQSLVTAANYAAMRTLLGLVPGTDVQVYNSNLATIAGLTATTDNFLVSVAGAWASRTPAQVRTTLGLVIGTNVQAYSANLTTWAGIAPSANAQAMASAADYAAMRTLLGLVIGTNVQAYDADLATIAGLTATTDNFIVSVASAWASRTPAQVKTTLALNNVDNTSDTTKFTSPQITGTIKEDVFVITDAAGYVINPDDGSIQRWTLTASRTPGAAHANWTDGKSVTLFIADGTAFAITWTTMGVVWKGGAAPVLPTSGYAEVNITKENGVLRGVHVGDFAS